MSLEAPSNIMNAVYLVGLGRVGSVIISKFIDLHRQVFQYVTTLERARKAGLGIEVEIIDMCLEPEVRKLLDERILKKGDHVIHLVAQADVYSLDSVRRFGKFYMPRLLKYLAMIGENIRGLSQGSGVFRYRPLARYFIYHSTAGGYEHPFLNMLFSDIRSDINDDLKPLNPQLITELYVVSLGGGFGSGSFIDIASIVDYMMDEHFYGKQRFKLFLLTLPIGFERRPRNEDLVFSRLEESQASAGAALLELLYILNKSLVDGYEDAFTKIVSNAMGLPRSYKMKFNINATIGLILSTYRRISGADIEDIYRNFDDQAVAALTILLQRLLREIYEADIQGRRAYFPSYREIADKLRMPRELLYPIATYGVEIIRLDLAPLLRSKIIELNSEKKRRECDIEALEQELKLEREEIEALNRCRDRLAKVLDSINEWREEGAKLDADVVSKLSEAKEKVREAHVYVENAWTATNSKQYREAQIQLSNAIQTSAVLEGKIEGLINEIRKICEDIKSVIERHRRVVDLIKHVNAEGVSELKHRIDMVIDNINSMRDTITRLGKLIALLNELSNIGSSLEVVKALLSKIVEQASSECSWIKRAPCKVRDNGEQLGSALSELESKIVSTYDSVNALRRQYEDLVNKLRNEISKAITNLESALAKKNESVRIRSAEIAEAREKVRELSSNMDIERARVLSELIARNTYLPERVANYIIELALERGIEAVKDLTISKLYSEFLKIDVGVAGQLLDNIVMRLREFLNTGEYRVSFIDPEILPKILGIDERFTIRQHKCIVLSGDEEELAELLKKHLTNVEIFVSKTIRGSYIAAVKLIFGIPLISINEFRELIHSYATRTTRRVYKVVEKARGLYDAEAEEYVEEYKGEAFHVLELDEDARRYIDEIINAVLDFDRKVKELGIVR